MATFRLDRFQLEAIAALDAGRSVLVAAPTGSGKTVVADAAIDVYPSRPGTSAAIFVAVPTIFRVVKSTRCAR